MEALCGSSIAGPVVATFSDASMGFRTDRVITPAVLAHAFAQPPPIGTHCPNKVMATGLTAQTVSGPMIATESDVKHAMSKEKIVTPHSLRGLRLESVPELMAIISKLQTRVEALEKEVRTLTLSERLPQDLAALTVSYE